MALLKPSFSGPQVPKEEKAVVNDILQHDEFSLLLLIPFRQLFQHVITADKLPNYLLAIRPATLQLLREVYLADVVASESSDRALTVLLCKAVLKDR